MNIPIGDYAVCPGDCTKEICGERDDHHAEAVFKALLARGLLKLNTVSCANVAQREAEIFELVVAIVRHLIILLIEA